MRARAPGRQVGSSQVSGAEGPRADSWPPTPPPSPATDPATGFSFELPDPIETALLWLIARAADGGRRPTTLRHLAARAATTVPAWLSRNGRRVRAERLTHGSRFTLHTPGRPSATSRPPTAARDCPLPAGVTPARHDINEHHRLVAFRIAPAVASPRDCPYGLDPEKAVLPSDHVDLAPCRSATRFAPRLHRRCSSRGTSPGAPSVRGTRSEPIRSISKECIGRLGEPCGCQDQNATAHS